MLRFFTLLLVCQLIGEAAVVLLQMPLPGPVVGMAILFTGLLVHGKIPTELEGMAGGLLANLSLLFVPAGVGIMLHADRVGAEFLPIAASLVVSTLITIVVTGWIMQKMTAAEDQ